MHFARAHIEDDESNSEDDPDYIPLVHDESSDEEPDAKRTKTSPTKLTAEEEAEKKRAAQEMWQAFKTSAASSQPVGQTTATVQTFRLVRIEKRYRFAGEDVVEVKEVPEDSEDAKKWPRWTPSAEASAAQSPLSTSEQKQNTERATGPSSAVGPSAGTSTMLARSSVLPASGKRLRPRKPKTTLTPLPGQQPKAKKLTVLDKSAMDWKTHLETAGTSSELQNELEANRRGGGYLEKVEFLKRVEERKEEALETASKAGKRRRS